jgi:hypothetical protein
MAGEVLVQVILKSDTGQDRDKVVNTYAFHGVDNDATREAIFDALVRLYNTPAGVPNLSVASYLSPTLNVVANQSEMRMYDISDGLGLDIALADEKHPLGKIPPHGSPIDVRLWTLGAAASAAPLPSECAMVLTLEALDWDEKPVEGANNTRPRSRYRGRIYYGPFGTGANENNAGVSRPAGDMRDVFLAAAGRMQDEAQVGGAFWGVWSRTRGAVTSIESISSANDWDTMRKRGERASVRSRLVVV